MAFKNLLLTFGGMTAFESSLAHAVKLADHYNGWLTCVFPKGPSFLERHGGGLDANVREMLRDASNNEFQIVEQKFKAAVKEAGMSDRGEFLGPDQVGNIHSGELARHFDMVITGLQAGDEQADNPDMLALTSGRPVLVVPPEYRSKGLAEHALVAWDGKRSAARAIGDAMGVLEQKGRVTVLTIGNREPAVQVESRIVTHLERHGIETRHIHMSGHGKSIAAQIEDTADEIDAKLIVMGAYEHSKFSQDLIGGVTHEVLRTARVPVFMAH